MECQENAVRGEQEQERLFLRGLREGLPAACEELYARFAPRLRSFATALLRGDAEAAENAVARALTDAVKDIKRFDSRRSTLSAWLYGIARRRVTDEQRRLSRLKSVPPAAVVAMDKVTEVAREGDLALEAASRVDARRQLSALASALTRQELEVLSLQCLDELSAKEIGQIVGRSERAVYSILHRAKQKARERLAQDED